MTMAQFSRDDILIYQGWEEGREEGEIVGGNTNLPKSWGYHWRMRDGMSWRSSGKTGKRRKTL